MADCKYDEGEPVQWDTEHLQKLRITTESGGDRTLRGPCPRCGHDITKKLDLGPVPAVARSATPGAETTTVFLQCDCDEPHGAPPPAKGCGAEGGVVIAGLNDPSKTPEVAGPAPPASITPEKRQADQWVESAYANRLANCRKLAQ
jgi:hypothetical protein